jgi:hypothetical protein
MLGSFWLHLLRRALQETQAQLVPAAHGPSFSTLSVLIATVAYSTSLSVVFAMSLILWKQTGASYQLCAAPVNCRLAVIHAAKDRAIDDIGNDADRGVAVGRVGCIPQAR